MTPWMRLPFLSLLLLLVLMAPASLMLGRYPLSIDDITAFCRHVVMGSRLTDDIHIATIRTILMDIRLPRVLAAVLAGAALSVAGAAFQAIFINPLVSPGLLGVLAGASFGAAVGMLFAQSWPAVQLGAFLFGLIAVFVSLAIASFYRGDRLLMLILGGIISASLFTALLSVVKYLADPYEQLPAIVYWLMGGLSLSDAKTVWNISIPMMIGIGLLIGLSGYINVLSLGDEKARSLGINVRAIRIVLILAASCNRAPTVVLSGMIGWVGLVVPHIAGMLAGRDNRILPPAAALIGAAYLLLVDDLCRLIFAVEIPIGILTALAGIPFFALVLAKAEKGWR